MLLEGYGTNADATDRSVALQDSLSDVADPGLGHRIEAKLLDDPRIDGATVTVTPDGEEVTIAIRLEVDGEEMGIDIVTDTFGRLVRVGAP